MAIEVERFKPYEKNTLRGFVDLKMTNIGLTLFECSFHEKNGKNWIGYPARQYDTDDGKKWSPVISFEDEAHRAFQKLGLMR